MEKREEVSFAALLSSLTSSPDSSIDIVAPAVEGDGYKLTSATTYTNSANVNITKTPGTSSVPPSISALVPAGAITGTSAGGLTPVNVSYSSGIFSLGVDLSLIASMSRTILLGATIGSIPSASTFAGALALLPGSITYSLPWTILVFPGDYVGASIPPNVFVIGVSRDAAVFRPGITITDTSGLSSRTLFRNLFFESTGGGVTNLITWNVSGKVGGNYEITLENCNIGSLGIQVMMRPQSTTLPNNGVYRDQLNVRNCVCQRTQTGIDSFWNISGGIASFLDTMCTSNSINLTNPGASGTVARLQVARGTFSPYAFSAGANTWMSMTDSILGGTWQLQPTNPAVASPCDLILDGCTINSPVAYSYTTPITGTSVPFWTLRCHNGSKAYIYTTALAYVLTRTSAFNWNLSFPNLLPGSGTFGPGSVDRFFKLMLLDSPNLVVLGTLTITLDVPLVSPLDATTGGSLPYVQTPVAMTQLSGAGTLYLNTSSTTTSVIALSAIIGLSSNNLAVEVAPPPYQSPLWYVN